jgi:hypothetical protein
MKRIFSSSRTMKIICVLLAMAFGGALVLAARSPRLQKARLPTESSARSRPVPVLPRKADERSPVASASPQTAQPAGPVQMVRFTVYDQGIQPTVAHASPGLVAIYLDDKSTHTAALLVANEQHPLGSINRAPGRARGHSTILLAAGRYTIYEADRKTKSATLVVAQ